MCFPLFIILCGQLFLLVFFFFFILRVSYVPLYLIFSPFPFLLSLATFSSLSLPFLSLAICIPHFPTFLFLSLATRSLSLRRLTLRHPSFPLLIQTNPSPPFPFLLSLGNTLLLIFPPPLSMADFSHFLYLSLSLANEFLFLLPSCSLGTLLFSSLSFPSHGNPPLLSFLLSFSVTYDSPLPLVQSFPSFLPLVIGIYVIYPLLFLSLATPIYPSYPSTSPSTPPSPSIS